MYCHDLMAVDVICNVSGACIHINFYKPAMCDYSCISTLSLAERENTCVRSLSELVCSNVLLRRAACCDSF